MASTSANTFNEQPLVSVYIPTKNRALLVKRAVLSVLEQTYSNIEILVVDDQSTDNTWQVLELLADEHPQIHLFKGDGKGACAARNIAIRAAKGEFITGLDDDDIFLPQRIYTLLKAFDANYAFSCSASIWDYGEFQRVIDARAGIYTLADMFHYNEASNQIFTQTQRLRDIGGFDEAFVACQDYDTWMRLMLRYGHAKRISDASYIVDDNTGVERMIDNPKSVKGYYQIAQRYGLMMNTHQKSSQQFMQLQRQKRQVSPSLLFKLFCAPHRIERLRYALGWWFPLARKLRRFFYKR